MATENSPEKIVRIGGGSGFWGDSSEGPRQLVLSGAVDYLVLDYLAEITMSILARMRAKNPALGYATDFVTDVVGGLGAEIAARKIKVITNAGGVNPLAARDAVVKELATRGVNLRVAAVTGDDVMPIFEEVKREGVREMWTGAPPPPAISGANAYIGALPVAAALAAGADIVITGRCADSAIALGPLIHEFGWKTDDFDQLAAGSLVGHVVECGPQATGGVTTDWEKIADGWANIGYPIAECRADGSFVVTKPAGTGGLLSLETVAEQVSYETGDPQNYVLPDVVCDFSEVKLEQVARDRVRVTGARGKAPTSTYKVSATYPDGYRVIATAMVNGINAVPKARAMADAILKRARTIMAREGLGDFTETSVEVLGSEAIYGPHARALHTRETILKIGVRHANKRAVDIVAREIAPATTSMGQGSAGIMGGRPSAQPVNRLYSFLLEKGKLSLAVDFEGRQIPVPVPTHGQAVVSSLPSPGSEKFGAIPAGETVTVPLVSVAYGRSGDKGDVSNITVFARRPEFLPVIAREVTPQSVAAYMAHLVKGQIERYPWPGFSGFNFLLHDALGGGGVASLRYDPQGKAHGQILMDLPIKIPKCWVDDGHVTLPAA